MRTTLNIDDDLLKSASVLTGIKEKTSLIVEQHYGKQQLKKKGLLQAPDDIDSIVEDEGFSKLPISLFHGEQAGSLEEIHRAPFDRMLIAQAQSNGLELLTADGIIPRYSIRVIDASKQSLQYPTSTQSTPICSCSILAMLFQTIYVVIIGIPLTVYQTAYLC